VRRRRRLLLAALGLILAASVIALALAPQDAHAAIDLSPGFDTPIDFGIPGPDDLVGKVFEFFFKTFFGIEAKVTRRAVEWLLATPIYTDTAQYGELNRLRDSVSAAGWALLTLMFAIAGVRYFVSGFTSMGSYEAIESFGRAVVAAGALAVYPEVFGSLLVAANSLTHGITHASGVEPGLTKVLSGVTKASFTPLGVGSIAAVIGVVMLMLLVVTKIVIATLLALLYIAAPLAIGLWPLPETSWMARTWLQSLIGLVLWPVVWGLCFALFAVMGASSFTLTGSLGTELVKPWVSVAALFVAFKAPQLLARQAMFAGLAPSLGTAGRALMYGRAATRAAGASSRAVAGSAGG
jgi:TrbL/VirB6 plasmid conjugal transfer protein